MISETSVTLDERVASLFEPDTLLPSQYFETFRGKPQLEPEKRLMLAVLEEGIACYQKYLSARDPKGKSLFQKAQEWILERDSNWLFSFEYICEVTGLDPEYVRQGLLTWKKRRLGERRQAKISRSNARKSKHPTVMRFYRTAL